VTPLQPDQVAGLYRWWAADKETAYTDGSPVTHLSNQSGTSVPQMLGQQPAIYRTNILNGLPVLRFDGVSMRYYELSNIISVAQPFTLFVVARTVGSAPAGSLYTMIGDTSLAFAIDSNGSLYVSGGAILLGAGPFTDAFHVFVAVYNGATSRAYTDGVLLNTGDTGSALQPLTGNFGLGFYSPLGSYYFQGDIPEVLVYSGNISDANIKGLTQGLKNKYGL